MSFCFSNSTLVVIIVYLQEFGINMSTFLNEIMEFTTFYPRLYPENAYLFGPEVLQITSRGSSYFSTSTLVVIIEYFQEFGIITSTIPKKIIEIFKLYPHLLAENANFVNRKSFEMLSYVSSTIGTVPLGQDCSILSGLLVFRVSNFFISR